MRPAFEQLRFLEAMGSEEVSSRAMAERMGVSLAASSSYITRLRRAGMIEQSDPIRSRTGLYYLYRRNESALKALRDRLEGKRVDRKMSKLDRVFLEWNVYPDRNLPVTALTHAILPLDYCRL